MLELGTTEPSRGQVSGSGALGLGMLTIFLML